MLTYPKKRPCFHCGKMRTQTAVRDIYCNDTCKLAWHEAEEARRSAINRANRGDGLNAAAKRRRVEA